ncbi:MlaD family protein [Planctomicrobium sp. SH664]|uniref:MlaD family protein n=1 Tax=Planctomicrobium sp. SH664 TaxID=3448125 RepID=UPI003F5C80AA
MNERQLQLRVGLFVVLALGVGAALILQFGDLKDLWKETYQLAIHFQEVPGLQPGSPVKQNGLTIGRVAEILLDDGDGGVLVVVEIHGDHKLRVDSRAHISRSLFGDSKVDFTSGRATEFIPPQSRLEGMAGSDPMEVVQRMEASVNQSLASFQETSREWQKVGRNLNNLMETNRGTLDEVIERTALALDQFNHTMETATTTFAEAGNTLKVASKTLADANALIADPQLQQDLRRTAAALPLIADETRQTIAAARGSIEHVGRNLDVIQQATAPLAAESDVIVRKLSGSLIQLESLLRELNKFATAVNTNDGSLQKFASDPELYRNLNRSAASMSVLMGNLDLILRDVRVFTDKVARHPEVLGFSGALRGSSGIKEAPEVQPAGHSTIPQR